MMSPNSDRLDWLSDALVTFSLACFILAALLSLLQIVLSRIHETEAIVSKRPKPNQVAAVRPTSNRKVGAGASDGIRMGITAAAEGSINGGTEKRVAVGGGKKEAGPSLAERETSFREVQQRKAWLELRKAVLMRQKTLLEQEVAEVSEAVVSLRQDKDRLKALLKVGGMELQEMRELREEMNGTEGSSR